MLTVSKSEQLTFESDLDDCIYFQLTEILSNWKEKKKASNTVREVFSTDKPNIQRSLIFLFFMFELCKKEITDFSFGRSFMVKKKKSFHKRNSTTDQNGPTQDSHSDMIVQDAEAQVLGHEGGLRIGI